MEGKYDGTGYGCIAGLSTLCLGILNPMNIAMAVNLVPDDMDLLFKVELEVLQIFGFRLQLSTPYEMACLILYNADPSFDFTEVHEKMQPILNFCLLDAQVSIGSDFPFFALAYTSIILALENLEWFDFAEEIRQFMFEPTSELAV
jgi:hypothetical protein